MSSNNDAVATGGGVALPLLGTLFVGLKLTGYIDWSWWLVTAPFWGPAAAILAILALFMTALGIGAVIALLLGSFK